MAQKEKRYSFWHIRWKLCEVLFWKNIIAGKLQSAWSSMQTFHHDSMFHITNLERHGRTWKNQMEKCLPKLHPWKAWGTKWYFFVAAHQYRKKCWIRSKTLHSLMAWLGEKRKTEFSWTQANQAMSKSRIFERIHHFLWYVSCSGSLNKGKFGY